MIRDSLGHLQVSDPTIIVEQFGGAHPEESVVVNLECDLDLLTGADLSWQRAQNENRNLKLITETSTNVAASGDRCRHVDIESRPS